jgi:hypothetical protein
MRFQPGSPLCESHVIFDYVHRKRRAGTRSCESREYLKIPGNWVGFCARQSLTGDAWKGAGSQGEGFGVHSVLDQQSENDREQNGEKKPSFHGGKCDISGRQVNRRITGQPVSIIKFVENRRRKCGGSGRVSAAGALQRCVMKADQYAQTFTVRKR